MPPNPPNDDLDRTLVQPVEPFLALVDRFDQMLAAGEAPKISDVLNEFHAVDPSDRLRRNCLLELLIHQQYHDWMRKGLRDGWDCYLNQWPELRGWDEAEKRLRQHQQECAEQLAKNVIEPPKLSTRPEQKWHKKFKDISELGRGGFGTVYSAIEKRSGQKVAIKTVDEFEISQRAAKKGEGNANKLVKEKQNALITEVKSLLNFRHENIVPILDFDFPQEPGQDWYVVYRFVDGRTLRGVMDESGPIDPAVACEITIKLARALHCAHQRNLIHQDIKPENILLNAQGEPFLIDFGLATSQDEILRGKSPGGTRWYLSKEQVEGKQHKICNRTDIYSLGVVLYEMLAGKRPLDAPNGDWHKAICEQVPVSLWVINPNAPKSQRVRKQLDAVCDQALKKEPEVRIASAEYMAEQLEEVVGLLRTPELPPDPTPKGDAKDDKYDRRRKRPRVLFGAMAIATAFAFFAVPPGQLGRWFTTLFDKENSAAVSSTPGTRLPDEGVQQQPAHPAADPAIQKTEPTPPPRILPKLQATKPPVGAPLAVGILTTIELDFDDMVKVGPGFQRPSSDNGEILELAIPASPVRLLTIKVKPASAGDVMIQIPPDFVVNSDQVGNEAVTLRFTAEYPPKFGEINWIASVPNDKKRRFFEVTFSKPVKPKQGLPQDWFSIYDGTAADGAVVWLDEPWIESRRQLRAEVRVKQEGALTIKFRSEFFVDESGISIAPDDDPDIDVDQRKLRGTFDWTPPKLVVDPLPKFIPLGEVLTVHAFSEKKERLKLRRSAISVPSTASIEDDPADGHEDFEFNIRIHPMVVGRLEVAIKEGLIADVAGNGNISPAASKTDITVLPNFEWVSNLEKQILQKLKDEDESGLKTLYEQINYELRDFPVAEIPWPLRMLRASIAFELAPDQMQNTNVKPQPDYLSSARTEFRDVGKKWPLNNPTADFGDSAFLVWIMVARADELQAEFDPMDPKTKIKAVEQSLVDLEKRISLPNPSRNRAIWFHERWHCVAIETSLLEESVRGRVLTPIQKTDFEKELQNQYQRAVQFLMDSYQSFATERGAQNLRHYLMPTLRSKIGPEMATQIEQILRAKPQARSPFDHISRFVEAYRKEFLSNAKMK